MTPHAERPCIAYAGRRLIRKGTLREVARATKELVDRENPPAVLVFDDGTSEPIEIDLRGTLDDVLARLPIAPALDAAVSGTAGEDGAPRAPGRPKLGVIAREVTLLPRHWEWLATQPGGASASLRRLVEAARRGSAGDDRGRQAREAAYRFMNAMAGDEPGFEESCRALFSGNRELFEALIETWPPDVREHATALAERSFETGGTAGL